MPGLVSCCFTILVLVAGLTPPLSLALSLYRSHTLGLMVSAGVLDPAPDRLWIHSSPEIRLTY